MWRHLWARWKDIVWLTSGFKSQHAPRAKFDKQSKFTNTQRVKASPRCIYPTQIRTPVIPPLWWKHIVEKTPGAERQLAHRLCDEPLTRGNQSGISDGIGRAHVCSACGFLKVTFRFSSENDMKVRKRDEDQQIFVRLSKYLTNMSTLQDFVELQFSFAAWFLP